MRPRLLSAAVVTVLGVLLSAAGVAAPALASQGSVPEVVASYASDPAGLLANVKDLFGRGTSGTGIAFDDTTKVGHLNRAFAFTADFVAGSTNEHPLKLTNEWTAPITVADAPVGLATIWINPQTQAPDLADFVADPSAGKALSDVPAEAYVVHDEPRHAWFTLAADVLTVIVPGTSGVTGPTTVSDYRARVLSVGATSAPVDSQPSSQGAINSIVIVSVAVLLIAAVLLAPGWRARRKNAAADSAADASDSPASPDSPADPPAESH